MKKEEITLKNTKAEILEALNESLRREEEMSKIKYEPEKEESKQKVKKAIEETKVNVEQKIFSNELIEKFEKLELSIQEEEKKLKDLYGIENELNNLVLVVNAGKDYMAKLENTKEQKTEEINMQIEKLEKDFNAKTKELENDYNLKSEELKKQRERENEEYNYKLKREREISNNNWEDEKTKRENLISEKEVETEKLLEDAKQNAKHIEELENKVNEIPDLLEKEYNKGKAETEEKIKIDNKYETELLKKDFQNVIDRQKDKIDSLNENIEKLNAEKKSLQEKLDKAYLQIKELATKTVESTGGVKILGNNNEAKV